MINIIIGFFRWVFKPSNDHADLISCIEYYKKQIFKPNKYKQMSQKLTPYQYLVLKHPDEDDDDSKETTTVLIDGSNKILLANSEQAALIQIARQLPEEELVNLDRIEFRVRAF